MIKIFGWELKFRISICRTTDISEYEYNEFWNNERWVIRYCCFRILFLIFSKLFEHPKYSITFQIVKFVNFLNSQILKTREFFKLNNFEDLIIFQIIHL